MVKTLALLTIADARDPIVSGGDDTVLVMLDREWLACADVGPWLPNSATDRATPSGTKVPTPRKVHDVKPVYPPEAQSGRIEGTVFLEAQMSAKGCVTSIHRLRSVHPMLDAAAIVAVAQWRSRRPR